MKIFKLNCKIFSTIFHFSKLIDITCIELVTHSQIFLLPQQFQNPIRQILIPVPISNAYSNICPQNKVKYNYNTQILIKMKQSSINFIPAHFKQLLHWRNNNNNIMTQQSQINTSSQKCRRDGIKLKLKGSLNAWKLNFAQNSNREMKIFDRTPETGTTVNNFYEMYEKKRKIGQGASGTVYQCISKRDGKTYAVKISSGDVELLKISKRAFKIMKGLNHPYIIKAHSLFLNQVCENIHFIMQYCPLPSLLEVYNFLDYEQKKQIVKQIIEALNYLHNQGVCHRDIKFENILYDQGKQQIKIIDFGICKQIFDKNHHHVKMWTTTGTLHYMAPEILLGGSYDEKVDMWALGVLTYKLFYGKNPFESEYKSEVIEQICYVELEYDSKDQILNDFIRHLICKDPNNRMSAFQSLKHPWIENDITTKQRLGSVDDFDMLLDFRMRNYSVGYLDSPQLKASREDRISELKQLSIFEEKKTYLSLNSVTTCYT